MCDLKGRLRGRHGAAGRWFAAALALGSGLGLAGCGSEASAPKPVVALATAPGTDIDNPTLAGLDAADRQLAASAERQALDASGSGKPVTWRSAASTARYGSVAAGPVFTQNGQTCRPFSQTVYIDGVPQTGRATACRQPDGAWRRSG